VRELNRQIRELERLLGKKTLDNERFSARPGACEVIKTALARTVAARGGFPDGVARSNLIEQVRHPALTMPGCCPCFGRSWMSGPPTAIVGALLSRQMAALGKPPVNHKRVYRLIKQNSLLLARHTGTGRQRSHDGMVRTLRSNLRWCSDVFEVPCWNGETVRVAFVLDVQSPDVHIRVKHL
jgi:hypothetical protein